MYQWWAICIEEGLVGWIWASSREEGLGKAIAILSIMERLKILQAGPQKINLFPLNQFLKPYAGNA